MSEHRVTRWSAVFADAAKERVFRAATAREEWRSSLTVAVVVFAVHLAILIADVLPRPGGPDSTDVAVQAVGGVLVIGVGAAFWWGRRGDRWGRLGPIVAHTLSLWLAVLVGTSPNMQFQGSLLLLGGILLIYHTLQFPVRTVTGIAVVYSVLVAGSWWWATAPGLSADAVFSIVVAVLANILGFIEIRRGRRADRLLFAQRAELTRLSTRDELTGLGNRRVFYRAADELLAAAWNGVAVLLLDLDRFKEINDTLGHAAGDELLVAVSGRMRAALPASCELARLGGDEFVALVPAGTLSPEQAAADILAALAEPIPLADMTVHVRASIGVAVATAAAPGRATLMRRADIAMYQAKARGGRIETYHPDNDHHSRDRVALASELLAAIGTDQITIYYQPKADVATGRVCSVEALVRWNHPVRGILLPADFLPLAQQQGLMRPLTLHVLGVAARQSAAWRSAGQKLRIAVNLSPANLLDARFPDEAAAVVTAAGASADDLDLEITEDTIVVDPDRILDVIGRLGRAGFRCALDDYGTGYSSISYLRTLPVQEIKIDQSFVGAMLSSADDDAIVHSTIDLAQRLGFTVVAEGVEDAPTLRRLGEYGCDVAQGYVLSPPVPAGELTAWLVARRGSGGI